MAITLTIAGVDRTAYLNRLSWSVQKEYANETFTGDLRDVVFSSSAYAPTVGQDMRLLQGALLLFGGRITNVRRARLEDEGPIVTTIDARGWEALAEEVIVTETLASTSALAMAYALFLTYLQPRGCTWLGSTSGGGTVPELVFDHQPLSQVFAQIGKLSGRLFRINGDKQVALMAPGDLTAPDTWTGSAVLKGFTFSKTRADRATRAYIRTGGSGTVTHSEGRTGNGVKTIFPVNVEPKEAPTTVNENGTVYALPSATWTWNAALKAIVRSSALGNGVPVTVGYPVEFPAWVRCWSSSIEQSTGALNEATAVDVVLQMTEVTDLAQAKALGDVELARRVSEPWVAEGTTRTPGWYPALRVPVSMAAEHGVTGDFLVTSVTVTPDDLDEETITNHVSYAVRAIQGDVPGRQADDIFRELLGSSAGGGVAIVGTSTGTGGTSSGGTSLPAGTTLHLAGANSSPQPLTTTWVSAPEAIPTQLGGDGMAGTWKLRVPMYQLGAGTLEARLYSQTSATVLATVTTTATASTIDQANFAFPEVTFTAPGAVEDVILQVRVASGARRAVIGHATVVKL